MFKKVGKIIQWAGDYKRRLSLGFICSFLSAWFTAGPVVLAAWMLHKVIVSYQQGEELAANYTWISFVLIVGFILLRFLCLYFKNRLQESIGFEIGAKERVEIGEILKKVSLRYFAKNSTGDILTALTTELSTLELHSMKVLDSFVNGYIQVAVTLLCIGFVSPFIAAIGLAGILVSAVFLRLINTHSKKTATVTHHAQEKLAGATLEYVRGLSIVKSFGQEGVSINRFDEANKENKAIRVKNEFGFVPLNCFHLLALYTSSAAMVFAAAMRTFNGQLPLAYLVMIAFFSFTIFSGVESINDAAHILSIIDSVLIRLDELKKTEAIDEKGKDLSLPNVSIAFQEVSFGYEEQEVLHQLTFDIPQNSTTAIVGPSGSGKSTICHLITRFYDVDQGSIQIGSHDVRELTNECLLANISMVFQNVYLFNDTIKNNIRFGKPEASEKEIIAAAKAARCHDFIISLPNGYETIVGEGGNTLSGGEKQRLSIARAMLKNAPIILLDEATASIDPENEAEIQQAISALVSGKTIIIIAHRLATIEHADQILVMESGKLVQQGTHQGLLQEEGLYQKFIAIRQQAENWQIQD